MKRLTRVFAETTHGTKGYEAVNEIKVDTESIHNLSEIITTLGRIEDVFEEYNANSIEEFEEIFGRFIQENKLLKQEIDKLEEKVVAPKFEKGQIIYFNDDYGQILSGTIVAFDYYTSSYIIVDTFSNELWKRKDDLFVTREEAHQKLAQLKRKE